MATTWAWSTNKPEIKNEERNSTLRPSSFDFLSLQWRLRLYHKTPPNKNIGGGQGEWLSILVNPSLYRMHI
ncbi:hypothetical protein L6164_011885 [Bauhinia variegata]|uniref:Uncharacterized protein n=1 Tax=Bauhinia variegata TaxID=167791 RepID=A0ACB9P9J2_BAUVA|nr:hypothetical protein L6164_011885 [Bauhinia variegata]